MRVTTRGVNIYGFIAIVVMLVMVAIVLFQWLPRIWHWRLFAIALTLFSIRIALRLALARQKRLDDEERVKTQGTRDETGGDPSQDKRT
jgi:Flp pilus assembly protein TadB